MVESETLYTADELARILRVSGNRARILCKTGAIKATNISTSSRARWRISREALQEYLTAGSVEVCS